MASSNLSVIDKALQSANQGASEMPAAPESVGAPSLSLSVVVCSRNGVEKLKRCVEAMLSVKTRRDWELVIVDNDSSDGTGEYLASLTARTLDRPTVRGAFEGIHGLAAARNRGWRAATGSIVAFTDDDCYASADYVDSILDVFEGDQNIGFLGGRILLFDASDQKITIQESEQREYFSPASFVAAGVIQGANMAFRRTVLEGIGGFDERMGHGTRFSCEDIDAVAAALWAGFSGVYDPRPVVYHHHGRRTDSDSSRLMRIYDLGRGAYFTKYILAKSSRWVYLRAWMNSVRAEFLGGLRRFRVPTMGRSRRELFGCMRFAVTEMKTRSRLK
jgi:GT2 family glycosyltransferase